MKKYVFRFESRSVELKATTLQSAVHQLRCDGLDPQEVVDVHENGVGILPRLQNGLFLEGLEESFGDGIEESTDV